MAIAPGPVQLGIGRDKGLIPGLGSTAAPGTAFLHLSALLCPSRPLRGQFLLVFLAHGIAARVDARIVVLIGPVLAHGTALTLGLLHHIAPLLITHIGLQLLDALILLLFLTKAGGPHEFLGIGHLLLIDPGAALGRWWLLLALRGQFRLASLAFDLLEQLGDLLDL